MEKELIIREKTLIHAPAAAVWDVLVNPEQTRKYMFGCEPVSGWKPGDPLLWKGVFDGKELVVVKGTVKAFKNEKLLTYTAIDPHADMPDIPENYTTVSYKLSPQDGGTMLEVTQGDFAKVAQGEKRYREVSSDGGWDGLLEQIKAIAEQR